MGPVPHAVAKLAKILTYVLGCQPDEFGLMPDPDGFVRIKRLLQALSEEPDLRYVRRSHLNELGLSLSPPTIEIREHLIRAQDRSRLPVITVPDHLPETLYIGIRQRAYPVVLERGIFPLGGMPHVVLARDSEQALRLGRRFAPKPILLTVQTAACSFAGVEFGQFGERLFLAAHIPAACFTGPPLPKEEPVREKTSQAPQPDKPKTPGSYFPDLSSGPQASTDSDRPRRNEMEWKKERRKARKEKQRRWV